MSDNKIIYSNAPDDAPVKIIERTKAYQGSILEVYDDLVEINGKQAHWDFIHHIGAAAVLPVLPDGRILMVRQYRNALSRYTLEIPAGKLNYAGEPFEVCAARELEEETGYRARSLKPLIKVTTYIAFCDEIIGVFLADDLEKTAPHPDEDEEIEAEAWALEDLKKMIYEGKITDSKTISAIMAYAAM